VFGSFSLTALTYGVPAGVGLDPKQIEALGARASEFFDGVRARSGVLLVARRGKVVFHEAYGPLTDAANSPPVQKDSIFSVNSITKAMTATAIMMLVEDGLLGLNRPLKEYIPEICGEGTDDIEVQHLLTHSSGYEEEDCWKNFYVKRKILNKDDVVQGEGQHFLAAEYLKCQQDLKLHFSPGREMSYCNHNYFLLVEVLRRVSKMAPEHFVKWRLLDPLSMVDSSYQFEPGMEMRQVLRGVGVPFGGVEGHPSSGNEGTWFRGAPWGFVGLSTTAYDLANFGQMFLNGGVLGGQRLLSGPTVREMTRNQIPGIGAQVLGSWHAEASWGLGWMIQGDERWRVFSSTLAPKGTLYHTGAGGHQMWIDEENEIVGVYLTVGLLMGDEMFEDRWDCDLFMNMVTAAVVD
jgi:CubicO group peptidase (beta-lactamase class C family)